MHVNKKLKGKGENLVKFDHVGNVIGRIIVDEQMNLPTFYWQIVLIQLQKLYGQQNGTRQHYATLPGSSTSYGKCTQIHTFKSYANLVTYLANWYHLYTPEDGFQDNIKHQGLHAKRLPKQASTN